jgi:DNA-binding transcriptional LysR family regulator
MDRFRSVECFVTAVEASSIAGAARKLGVTPAAVSQAIRKLEDSLHVTLLTRTTRSISLTEAGSDYYARVKPLTLELQAAGEEIAAREGEITGRLRIACSVAYGRHRIARLAARFAALHPKLQLELFLSDSNVDHVNEDIDVSVRFGLQLEPGLIARKIAVEPMFMCAAPSYLERRGWPITPDDLSQHDCLTFRFPVDGRLMRWSFTNDGVRTTPVIRSFITANDVDSLAEMALEGLGVTRLSNFIVERHLAEGRLKALFTGEHGPRVDSEPFEFHACYLDRRARSEKVRLFIDFLLTSLKKD